MRDSAYGNNWFTVTAFKASDGEDDKDEVPDNWLNQMDVESDSDDTSDDNNDPSMDDKLMHFVPNGSNPSFYPEQLLNYLIEIEPPDGF